MAILSLGATSFATMSRQGGQIRAEFPKLKSLKLLRRLHLNSRPEFIANLRALFGIVGVFVAAYSYSPSVMAEGEDVSSQDESTYGSNIHAILRGVIDNTIDLEGSAGYGLSDADYYHMNNIHIPEAVWSADLSAIDHFGRILGRPDSASYAGFDGRLESNAFGARMARADFWYRIALGLWNDSADNHGRSLLIPPALFQVASCGGNSAEHSGLDFCGNADTNADNVLDDNSKNGNNANNNSGTQNINNNVVSSDSNSTAPSANSSTPANIIPPMASNFSPRGDLTLASRCSGVSVSCTPFDIELPAALIDSYAPDPSMPPIVDQTVPIVDQTVPIVDQTVPIDDQTVPIGDQTPPPVPPPPGIISSGLGGGESGDGLRRPIPEAPTWVMTAIGFSVVAFLFRRKKKSQADSISIIDNP